MHPAMLIAAYSGRALAQAARRAGYQPSVADIFGDADTLAAANHVMRVEGDLSAGFTATSLLQALHGLMQNAESARTRPRACVYGAGFESDPHLLHAVRRVVPLAGNAPDVVAAVKAPGHIAALCRDLDISHPVNTDVPPPGEGWLLKTRGSAGGGSAHHWPGSSVEPSGETYWQRRVPGEAMSLLLLADGQRAEPVGFSRQYCAPAKGKPFRFGGAVTCRPPSALAADLVSCAGKLTAATGLRGLNSLDFIVHGQDWWLIEVNPRPGATLDLFDSEAFPLFHAHVEAVNGHLLQPVSASGEYRALWIAYADAARRVPSGFAWPMHVSDRPHDGTLIPAGDPVATVFASAGTPADAHALARSRASELLSRLVPVDHAPATGTVHAPH